MEFQEDFFFELNDERVFKKVFDTFHEKIFNYFIKNGCHSFLAQDLTQDTFIKLYRYRNALNKNVKLSTQLFQIAKTTMYSHFRKRSIQTVELKNFDVQESDNIPYQENYPDHHGIRLSLLKDTIQDLPHKCKEIFMLSKYDNLSNKEIAQFLNISIKTVETQMSRAFKTIKTKMNRTLMFLLITLYFLGR